MDRLSQMVPINGGTNLVQSDMNRPNRDSPDERNLSYHDISFHFKYEGNLEELKAFLEKILPVARLASLQHDIAIDIENGDKVVETVDKLLDQFEIKGRRTIGLFGYYSIIMPSGPHYYAVKFTWRLYLLISALLGIEDIGAAVGLLDDIVHITGDARRVFQDGTTERLAEIVEAYCSTQLQDDRRVPCRSVERRSSNAYEKEPDQSFQPAYQVLADNSIDLPTVICEVGMSDVVSKVIFDCLSSLAGSRGKIDLSFGTDLAVNNQGLNRIRLFVFDSTVTTLVDLAEENQSVARFTRDKVENRLLHLYYLRDHLRDNVHFRRYLRLEHRIGPTIEYYEERHRALNAISAEELTEQDIVETCRVVLRNAQVVQMDMEGDRFNITDIKGEPLDRLAVKVESFLGLFVDEPQVVLNAEELENKYLDVAESCEIEQLEGTTSPIPLILSSRHISGGQRYQEFVTFHGLDSNQAFMDGQAVTVQNVKLVHLRDDTVIIPAAKVYLDLGEEDNLRSRALRISCALCWFREKQKEGLAVYDLADLDRRPG